MAVLPYNEEDEATQPFLVDEDVTDYNEKRQWRVKSKWSPRDVARRVQTSICTLATFTTVRSIGSKFDIKRALGWAYQYPPHAIDSSREETAWLDGLRGLAAFFVMMSHFDEALLGILADAPYGAPELYQHPESSPAWQIHRLPILRLPFYSGHAQVSVFFVLSGFVLSWVPLKAIRRQRQACATPDTEHQQQQHIPSHAQHGPLDKFTSSLASLAFRRWLRLFLPCFLAGLISMFTIYFGLTHMPFGPESSILWQLWDYMKACEAFANPFHLERNEMENTHKYNWVMWTIPLEWGGSLIVFLMLLSLAQIQSFKKRGVITLFVSMYACYCARWTYWLFSMGLLLADYVQEFGGFEKLAALTTDSSIQLRVVGVVVLLMGIFLAGSPSHNPFYTRTGYDWLDQYVPTSYKETESGDRFWWSCGAILIVVSCSHFSIIRRFFQHNILRYLGRVSFMLYLTHQVTGEVLGTPILVFTRGLLEETIHDEKNNIDVKDVGPLINWFLLYWSNIIFLVPLALFFANWLELIADKPSRDFARWAERWMMR